MRRYDNETDDDLAPWLQAVAQSYSEQPNTAKEMDADLMECAAIFALRAHRTRCAEQAEELERLKEGCRDREQIIRLCTEDRDNLRDQLADAQEMRQRIEDERDQLSAALAERKRGT